jgi:dienelactone hydrolase
VARLVTVSALALALVGLAVVSACSQATTTSGAAGTSASSVSSPAAVPGTPAATEGAWVDQAVAFQAGGMTVYGTYRHPVAGTSAGSARMVPAVVLIPGNAFTDRNGNTPLFPGSINEIKAVAGWLSADGVASLRFDRIGSGQTGFGPYAASKATIGGSLPDTPLRPVEQEAAAALRFLASQRGIDPARLGVIGHSEGALYALLLAAGVSPEGSGSQPLPHVRALGLIEPYHGDWRGYYDPAKMVAGLSPGTPVLVTCSSADLRVDCPDVSNLRARLAGAGAAVDFVPLTGVDHVLKQDATGMAANYTKPLQFSRQLRQALRSFVLKNL